MNGAFQTPNSSVMAGIAVAVIILLVFGAGFLQRRRPRMLKVEYFEARWKTLQQLCGDKTTWPLAIIDADKLVDDALKRNRFKGKTMGERLVAAQRSLNDNDGIWYAHKLRNKLVHEEYPQLREQDVKSALVGFRQALRDLGALK